MKGPMLRVRELFSAHKNDAIFSIFLRPSRKEGRHVTIGTIQRRLAWPLRKDDIMIREQRPLAIFFFFFFSLLASSPAETSAGCGYAQWCRRALFWLAAQHGA